MWLLCVLVFTRPWLLFFSCFSLVFISFPSSNFSPSPSYSSQLHPFAFFHLLRSLSLPLLTLTVMSSCYFSQKLACHNLCRWVISVGLYSATMAPEKGQPKKKKSHPRKVTSSSLPKKDDGPPHLEYQPENQQREDGVVERGWRLTFDSIHPNTKTVYCQTSSNTYDLVVSETDRQWEKWFVLSYVL